MRLYVIIACLFGALAPQIAVAQCRMAVAGSNCVSVPQSQRVAPSVEIGEVLDRGAYSMLMNSRYYDLPPVSDGWVYMRIDNDIYRVDWRSHEVLERVTDQANSRW